jgi:N-acetylglutamate synthase-like GNAT family acetyltransferase
MDIHKELSPWLAGLYVHPDHRKKGIGSALVNHLLAKVQNMGLSEIFLYTSSATSLYKKLGWRIIAEEFYQGEGVNIMVLNFA